MNRTIVKLRIFGIVTFLLFVLSAMYEFQPNSSFYFTQIQQILILVSFIIFAILILLQLYGFYIRTNVKKEETDS
jgi:heme/copper-type cytochrome/quinol oxidase subunit 2